MLSTIVNIFKIKILSKNWYLCRFLASFAYGKGIQSLLCHGRLSMMADHDEVLYDAVNIDINNTCNLRCRFCFNTFENKHHYMKKEMFENILPIIPLVRDITPKGTGVYLSCLYEPTLSPYFFDFLDMLPPEGCQKVFFTSNFCRTLNEEQLRRMLKANLHHINISIETLHAERYYEICSSMHFDYFFSNLQLLQKTYSEMEGTKPLLRFITMVLNCNRDEIIPIMQFCSEKLHAYEHELRTPYISTYDNMEWNYSQLMDEEECRKLEVEVAALGIRYVSSIHSKDGLTTAEAGKEGGNETELAEESEPLSRQDDRKVRTAHALEELSICQNEEFLFMRIYASGVCRLNVTGETFPLPEDREQAAFYKSILVQQYKRRAHAFIWADAPQTGRVKRKKMKVRLEALKANEVYITIQGRCRVEDVTFDSYMLTLSAVDKNGQKSRFFTSEKPEEESAGESGNHEIRFEAYLDRERLQSYPIRLTFYLTSKETLEDEWKYGYPYEIYWH